MKYVKLGGTGLDVSKLCIGCMSFGIPGKGIAPWSLDEDKSREIIKRAIELGINFFDTANVYSAGTSEEIVGRALKDYAKRDEIVLATKVYFPVNMGSGSEVPPNKSGLSRKAIMAEIDASLQRLGTDYVDLYQIHRWDYGTPIEETMEALHDVVKAGKARYIGASSMYAWQFAKAQHTAERNGWTKFSTMQDLYNLLYREEEREMLPLCKDQNIGVIPWSPLAKGKLLRDLEEQTARSDNDSAGRNFFPMSEEADRTIVGRVAEIAEKKGIPRVHVALAWVLGKDTVTAPIIGSTKVSHLEQAVGALDVTLTEEELQYLESPYVPKNIVGFE